MGYIEKVAVTIEQPNGDSIMSFMVSVVDGKIIFDNFSNCNIADVEDDYIFNSDSLLFRIQQDD